MEESARNTLPEFASLLEIGLAGPIVVEFPVGRTCREASGIAVRSVAAAALDVELEASRSMAPGKADKSNARLSSSALSGTARLRSGDSPRVERETARSDRADMATPAAIDVRINDGLETLLRSRPESRTARIRDSASGGRAIASVL